MACLTPMYRPWARYDIESIVVYIGQVPGPPKAVRAWFDSLKEAVSLLCGMPDLGHPFEDDRLVLKGRRSYLVGSYRLFYSYSADVLTVWRVVHVSQDIDDYALVDLID